MNRVIWRNGEFIDWAEATVHVLSQSLQRGSLAFDYIGIHRTARGPAVFRLDDHIDRLLRTCALMDLPLGYSREQLIEASMETLRRNPEVKSLRISALNTSVDLDLVPQDPSITVFIAAFDFATDIAARNPGTPHYAPLLRLTVERNKRSRREDAIPPQAKVAASYTPSIPAKLRARRAGFDDIILLDEADHVTEAPTANLFAVVDGGLLTAPGHKVLLGITRDTVMQAADALNIPCNEADFGVDTLLAADEVFLTTSGGGIIPVTRVNGRILGNDAPGPVSMAVKAAYWDWHKRPDMTRQIAYDAPRAVL